MVLCNEFPRENGAKRSTDAASVSRDRLRSLPNREEGNKRNAVKKEREWEVPNKLYEAVSYIFGSICFPGICLASSCRGALRLWLR